MSGELTGKVAIITGGASGIGKGCVARFVDAGAKVVIADVNAEAGEAYAAELGDNAAFKQTDVSKWESVRDVVDFAVETFGGLHVMFNNAGISGKNYDSLLDHDFSDFEQVMAINVLGVAWGIKAAGAYMKEHGGGSIINTTSIGGMQVSASNVVYGMSKANVIMLSQSAAIALGPSNIRINCIAPANIESPILGNMLGKGMAEDQKEAMMDEVRAWLIARQPLPRQGTTDDIAEAAIFLASERSSYSTGQVICVDGGMLTGNPNNAGGLGDIIAKYRGTS